MQCQKVVWIRIWSSIFRKAGRLLSSDLESRSTQGVRHMRKKQTKMEALLELMYSKEGREMMKHTNDFGGHLISGNKRCNIWFQIDSTGNVQTIRMIEYLEHVESIISRAHFLDIFIGRQDEFVCLVVNVFCIMEDHLVLRTINLIMPLHQVEIVVLGTLNVISRNTCGLVISDVSNQAILQ